MKSKTITIIIFAIITLIFCSIFFTNYLIFERNNTFENKLDQIAEAAKQGDWDEANQKYNEVFAIWNSGKRIVSLNYAEADYSKLSSDYYALGSVIETKNTTETVKIVKLIKEHHHNFRKFIPEP